MKRLAAVALAVTASTGASAAIQGTWTAHGVLTATYQVRGQGPLKTVDTLEAPYTFMSDGSFSRGDTLGGTYSGRNSHYIGDEDPAKVAEHLRNFWTATWASRGWNVGEIRILKAKLKVDEYPNGYYGEEEWKYRMKVDTGVDTLTYAVKVKYVFGAAKPVATTTGSETSPNLYPPEFQSSGAVITVVNADPSQIVVTQATDNPSTPDSNTPASTEAVSSP